MAKPTDNSEFFLDQLIASIQSHLPTIKGIYVTTSLYPGLIPGPGIVFWSGYSIPPAKPGAPPTETPPQEVLPQNFEESTTLSPEEEAAANFATDAGYSGTEALAIGQTVGKQIRKEVYLFQIYLRQFLKKIDLLPKQINLNLHQLKK